MYVCVYLDLFFNVDFFSWIHHYVCQNSLELFGSLLVSLPFKICNFLRLTLTFKVTFYLSLLFFPILVPFLFFVVFLKIKLIKCKPYRLAYFYT